ncbi:unnamed protein product [Ixodes persulcatus]
MAQVDANCFWAEQDGGAPGVAWPYASAVCGEHRSGGHLAQLSSASEVDVVLERSAALATSRRPQLPELLWIAAFLNFSADAFVALAAISELSVDILSPTSAMLEWNMSRNSGWQPRGLKLDIWRIVPDEDAQQQKPAIEGSPRPSPAVMVIRIMGCCVVLILTGLTLIVFLTSGTAYPDVVAQIFSEFSIMGAYTCVLMTTTDQRQLTEKQCMVAAVCLQFFFLSSFLFLMLESAYMAKLLVGMFPESLPFNNVSVSVAGWGVPAIITGLFAWAFPDKYTRGGQV